MNLESDLETEIEEIKKQAAKKIQKTKDKMSSQACKTAKTLDVHAKKEPWILIGIFSFLAMILGFILGKSSGRR